jgi:hypothetical protein
MIRDLLSFTRTRARVLARPWPSCGASFVALCLCCSRTSAGSATLAMVKAVNAAVRAAVWEEAAARICVQGARSDFQATASAPAT